MKKFAEWLSGGFNDEEQTTSPLIKIKVFNKRLARQIRKIEVQEKMAKKRAIDARKSGDIAGSKLHMKNSLQYRKWGHSTEHFRMKIENIQFRLQQAKVMGQFNEVAEDIVGTLQGLQLNVKMPEMAKMLKEMDLGFGSMDAMMDTTTSQLEQSEGATSETEVSDSEVENALAEIDTEMSMDSVMALPSVPISDEPEAQIEDLEEEIKKLKESRKN
ncbi:Snf7 family protein [Candidatus Lokiarchaeum ossiferum]|uniref:Snf7 family protein n=1 Tax=Candidatus Lokiarchaeum ossiferum TaxID=2951803 RepID=UPI00352EDAB2